MQELEIKLEAQVRDNKDLEAQLKKQSSEQNSEILKIESKVELLETQLIEKKNLIKEIEDKYKDEIESIIISNR